MFPNVSYVVHSILFYFEVEGIHQRNLGQSFFICIMSTYPYPWHYCRTPPNLDLYLSIQKKKLKNVNPKFQAKVGYQTCINHLQDYKIYVIVIKMFIPEFLSNLPQPPRDNPWPKDLINRNFITQFHRQCDYLLGFQASKKINNSVPEKKMAEKRYQCKV